MCDYGTKNPDKVCKRKLCFRRHDTLPRTATRRTSVKAHPHFCPASARVGVVRKWLRRGRVLHLPRRWVKVQGRDDEVMRLSTARSYTGDGIDDVMDYTPVMETDTRYGNDGKINVFRTNPTMGSSNPVMQSTLRCNGDVQCMDRVFALVADFLVQDDLTALSHVVP